LSSRGDNSLATTGVDIAKRLGVVGSERWFPVCNAIDRKKFSASQNYRSQKDDTMAASIHHVMDRQEPESKRAMCRVREPMEMICREASAMRFRIASDTAGSPIRCLR
jgi:hypothetical protein